ncbi:MAG: hypothetical protein ACRELB_09150, partial [Polyangiaceae bacterium]
AIVAPVALPRAVDLPRRRALAPPAWAVLGYALLAALLLLPLLGGSRPASIGAWASSPAPRTPAASPRHPVLPADVLVDAQEVARDSGFGLLETPGSMANHRVFVDGIARGVGGALLRVACGIREVRLGSAGRLQWIRVPCEGRVSVTP